VNDLGGEPSEEFMNGDYNEAPPTKRIRKSTFLSSMYEYEPIIKPRKSVQNKVLNGRAEFLDAENEEQLRQVTPDSEDANDDYYENYLEFPASEQFVIQNLNGDEEGFVFEQYDDSQGYQCNECEETYRDKLQMIIHMSYHFNNRLPNNGVKLLTIKADSTLLAPYRCLFCEERFINKNYRKRHLCKRHSDDIFKCDICEKLFVHKKTLKRHCKQHMIETKYHCEYCRKCFTSPWFLKRHMRRHCEKKLAFEELSQVAPSMTPPTDSMVNTAHSEIVQASDEPSPVALQKSEPITFVPAAEEDTIENTVHSDFTFVDNFDDLVKEEEIYID
jgi:hypothetical protein